MPVLGSALGGVGAGQFGWNAGQTYYDSDLAQANAAGSWANKNAKLAADANRYGSQQAAQASMYGSGRAADANIYGSQLAAGTSRYGTDAQTAAAAADRAQKGSQFNSVYGTMSGLLNGQAGGAYGVGGTNTPQSAISEAPIWNPGQVDARVNDSRSQLLASAQAQQRAAATKMAGQGFGSRSPALASIQSNLMAQAQAKAMSGENDIRWNAAQGNAAQVLKAQQAKEQQWSDFNQADIERKKTATNYSSSLAAALAGLI